MNPRDKQFTKIEVIESSIDEYELYIHTDLFSDEAIPRVLNESKHIKEFAGSNSGKLRWGINNLGIVNFGFVYDDMDLNPTRYGYWPSNQKTFEIYTGIKTVNCSLIDRKGEVVAINILIDKVNIPSDYLLEPTALGYRLIKAKKKSA